MPLYDAESFDASYVEGFRRGRKSQGRDGSTGDSLNLSEAEPPHRKNVIFYPQIIFIRVLPQPFGYHLSGFQRVTLEHAMFHYRTRDMIDPALIYLMKGGECDMILLGKIYCEPTAGEDKCDGPANGTTIGAGS